LKESKEQTRDRARKIVANLKKAYPQPKTALEFVNPLQLMIATILSAQCTDEQVNKVTPLLFRKYPTAKAFANADPKELERDIYSTGFYRNKTKNIIACCQELVQTYGGTVPNTMEQLVDLPGVGRKTANCVLGAAFGTQSGIVVDTHVMRLAGRMGLSKQQDAAKIERDLMVLVPQNDWYDFSNMMILHGRNVCDARKPDCRACVVKSYCPSAKKFSNLSAHPSR
jgi:endonuclease-3